MVVDPADMKAYQEAARKEAEGVVAKAKEVKDSFGEGAPDISFFEKIQEGCQKLGFALGNITELTGEQAAQFGLLSTALIGTKVQFQNLGQELDTNRLGTFTEQVKTMISNVDQQGTALNIATGAGAKLVDVLTKLVGVSPGLKDAIAAGGHSLAVFAQNIMTGADNTLRLESAMMQGMAQAGNLDQLYKGVGATFKGVGEHLDNLNSTTQRMIAIMGQAAVATQTNVAEMGNYAAALLKIPGGAQALSEGIDVAGAKTNTLTTIMQLAQGAGLDINKTFQDIYQTVSQLGVGVDGATKFETRFVDISKDLHVQQKDVHAALTGTAEAFAGFVMKGVNANDMAQNMADAVKQYASSLEAAEVPAQRAMEIAGRMTRQLEGMGEAQEALVSQQTGGPGGLLGALKFEDLLRQDPRAAAAKMQEALKATMGGEVVTKQEAEEGGEGAVGQYIKQRKILMDGLLGITAGSKEEADAMIIAMREGKALPKTEKEGVEATLRETTRKGMEQEQLTSTAVKQANIVAEVVQLQAGAANLGTLQNLVSARSGTGAAGFDTMGGGLNVKGQDMLREGQAAAIHVMPGSTYAPMFRDLGNITANGLKMLESTIHDIRDILRGHLSALGPTESAMRRGIESRTVVAPVPTMQPPVVNPPTIPGAMTPVATQMATILAPAPPVAASTAAAGAIPLGTPNNAVPVLVKLDKDTGITVNITSTCPNCRNVMKSTQVNQILSEQH